MQLNQLISNKLHTLLEEYKFKKVKELKNIVRYESEMLSISFVHNPRENSNGFWIGSKSSGEFIEINNQILSDFFHSNRQINSCSQQVFVDNIFTLLTNQGKPILEGNTKLIADLESFHSKQCDLYTADLIKRQNLKIVDRAWNDGNYLEVIKYLEKIKSNLPASYRQKFKIAKKKLNCD